MAESPAPQGSFPNRRLIGPLKAQLRQRITPETIALTIAYGAVFGVFPVLGSTTLLCGLAGWRLKLNQPIIQIINMFVYPLQLILLLPFYSAGETLFQQPHVPIFSVPELMQRFAGGPLKFMADYGMVALYGIAVWCLLAPPVAALIYALTRPALRVLAARVKPLHLPTR